MKNIVALTLIGLAVEAMAVTPVAVWDGDFTTAKKGEWTLSSTGSTITDAKIAIGSTPITMTPSTDQKGGWYTVIYKVKGLKNTSRTPLATWGRPYVAGYNNADLVGAFLDTDYVQGVWNGAERVDHSQQLKIGLSSAGTEEHRVIVRFHSGVNYGVWTYVDGTKVFTADYALKATMDVNRMTVLGFQYNSGNVLTGAEVTGLAIFSESSDAGDAAYVSYKFPSDPKTYAATASSGEVAWADLQWTPEGGGTPVSSAELPKNGILQVTVSSGATLLVAGSDAAQVAQLESITGPGTIRKVGEGATTIASGKIQASGLDAQPLAAIEVSDGTLKLGNASAYVFSAQNRVGVPLTVTGGTLDLSQAVTFTTADGSGWLYSKPITLGGGQGADRPTIVGGSVTPYKAGELEMLHYVGDNGANAPATFGAAIYSTYQKDNRVRKVNVEKGRGSAEGGFDLEMTGILGTHNDSAYLNAFLFTKTGEGVLRVSNTNNFPNTTVSAGTYQLGCPEALPANLSVASAATLDLGGLALTNRSLTCGGTIANGTLVSSGVTVNLTGATIGAGLALVADLENAIAGLKPFAGVDYAQVTTVGENPYLTYNTATGTFTLRDDCKLGDELKWLPIGDSITEGEQYMGHPGQGDANSRGGYRYQLWNEFEQAGQVTRSVGYRTGHSGTVEDPETCRWAWHAAQYGGVIMHDNNGSHGAAGMNVENTLEVAGYPDIVTVLIGVNDLSFTDGSVEQCGWVFTTLRNMVAKYADQRPHSKIVVSTLLPAGGSRAYIPRFNKIMRDAHAAGTAPFDRPNVVFADVPMIAFNDAYESQYFRDGLHPNETGAKIVAAAWMKALQPVMAALAQSNAVPVQVHNGTSGKVSVRFSKAIKSIETATLTISGTNVNGRAENWTFTGPTIKSGDTRVVEFDAGAAVLIGGNYTATLTDVVGTDANNLPLPSSYTYTSDLHLNIHGTGAAANVPAAFRKGFERLQAIDVTECNYGGNGPNVPCEKLLKAAPVTHVGYYVELQRANEAPQFVWVSMDAKPFNYATNNVGIPTVKGGIIRSRVTELQVYGNHGNFTNTAIGDTTQTGVIEFSPWTAAGTDLSDFPKEFKANKFGWNDTLTDMSTLKGCMQVARETHAKDPDDYTRPSAEMIFGFNTFNSNNLTDLGIGTFSTHRTNAGGNSTIPPVYDWTDFVEKTGYTPFMLSAYQVRKIEIWVKTPKTSMMLFVK